MFCAISGQTPEEPVVSTKSGHIFEKRLVEKYIATSGTCPVTKEPLTKDDLIPLQTGSKSVKPRPVNASSIPGMLALFQNEWDALMLETFTLKQHLDTVRQELSHALYQHDAACRVIARLMKERDAARSALAAATAQIASVTAAAPLPTPVAPAEAMEVEQPKAKAGLSADTIKKMTTTASTLSKGRKKRQPPASLATPETIEKFNLLSSNPIHKSTQPGILCVDINPRDPHVTVTGGVDTNAVLFNRETGKVTATLAGHSKKVSGVIYHPTDDLVFTCSADKTTKIWSTAAGSSKCVQTFKDHSDEVTGITLHATGDYIVTSSLDKTWALYDIRSGLCLAQIADPNVQKGYSAVQFHPDGLILGTGTAEKLIRIWDIKSQSNVATFEGHNGIVTSLSFSENGYYLATAAEDSTVKLWDLRKAGMADQCNFRTVTLDEGHTATSVSFDYSGQYLAFAGTDVRVYAVKGFNQLKTLTDHTALITDIKFGPDASFLASTSMDRTLKFFG